MPENELSVLVVGQTPPPYGGQAVMIQQLLNADIPSIRFCHVRMAFSENMDAIGKFHGSKIIHLFSVVFRVIMARIRFRPSVLYYPPAGPNRVPFYRDAVILIPTRWMFRYTVFHFHASGISAMYERLNKIEKLMFRLAYGRPSLAIRTSALNPDDGVLIRARNSIVVENGLPDVFDRFRNEVVQRKDRTIPRILFVGALYRSKGVRDLVDACGRLKSEGVDFKLELVGRFESEAFESEIRQLIDQYHMRECTVISGVLLGDNKWAAYARADVFCFPSYFESESFGLVNVEAMQFELPVVTTNWRGIPGVVEDGRCGFLVEISQPEQIAEKLKGLLEDRPLRESMGREGRKIFLNRFSEKVWSKNMERAFSMIPGGGI
jgi:glycosyltransferase involved in cell wall biosynthesis